MRAEHAAFVLTKVLQAGRLFEAFSRAAETMAAISKVRDRTDALQKEAEECKRRGNTERLQQLLIEMEALEEEEELIAWGDFEDPRLPGVELPYNALDHDGRMVCESPAGPLASLGPPSNTPSVDGGPAVYAPQSGLAGPLPNMPSMGGVPVGSSASGSTGPIAEHA